MKLTQNQLQIAYEGGIGQKYVKKQKRKRKVPKWLDHYVGSGEVEGELSSVVGEEIVDEIPGGDGGLSQEEEGSLADAESTSAYAGGELNWSKI